MLLVEVGGDQKHVKAGDILIQYLAILIFPSFLTDALFFPDQIIGSQYFSNQNVTQEIKCICHGIVVFALWTTGPYKRFPVPAVTDILKDVLTSYLQEEKYEVEWSQKMTKTICEVKKKCHLFSTI